MPIYEYECRDCEHRFERMQKFSDDPVDRCPECGGTVDRLISPPAIRFKGSGWYVTDYSDKGKAKREASEAEEKKAADDSGGEKAKTKATKGSTGSAAEKD